MKITKHATDDTSYFNSGKTCNLKFISLKISISNTKRRCCESAVFNMPAKQWPQDWKRAGALGRPRGMVWGGRREGGSGWGTHVCLWRIHFDIWQNQYNNVKFKNKIKFFKKLKK